MRGLILTRQLAARWGAAALPLRAPSASCSRLLASAASSPGRPEVARGGAGSGEEPRDAAGNLAQGPGMVVQPPLPNMSLEDPAAPDAPMGLLQRVSEGLQDLIRPGMTRGRAYHYAEDSARAVVQEQLASGRGIPGVESMYAPPDVAGADGITAPRSWHFSNMSDLLDERRQEAVAAQPASEQQVQTGTEGGAQGSQ